MTPLVRHVRMYTRPRSERLYRRAAKLLDQAKEASDANPSSIILDRLVDAAYAAYVRTYDPRLADCFDLLNRPNYLGSLPPAYGRDVWKLRGRLLSPGIDRWLVRIDKARSATKKVEVAERSFKWYEGLYSQTLALVTRCRKAWKKLKDRRCDRLLASPPLRRPQSRQERAQAAQERETRVYLAAPMTMYKEPAYDAALSRLAALFPDHTITSARDQFADTKDWLHQWQGGLFKQFGKMAFITDGRGIVGKGVYEEVYDASRSKADVYWLTPDGELVPYPLACKLQVVGNWRNHAQIYRAGEPIPLPLNPMRRDHECPKCKAFRKAEEFLAPKDKRGIRTLRKWCQACQPRRSAPELQICSQCSGPNVPSCDECQCDCGCETPMFVCTQCRACKECERYSRTAAGKRGDDPTDKQWDFMRCTCFSLRCADCEECDEEWE